MGTGILTINDIAISREKIILLAFMIILGFSICQECFNILTKRGKTLGTFHHFVGEEDAKDKICYEYLVNGTAYYCEIKNHFKETEDRGQKAKLRYDLKKPEKAVPDGGFAWLVYTGLLTTLLVIWIIVL